MRPFPINETTNYSVDSITPQNPQIGQKNLHFSTMGMSQIREYIEFHSKDVKPG